MFLRSMILQRLFSELAEPCQIGNTVHQKPISLVERDKHSYA